ncbi:MAG: trigger factor [Elusimicrobia bacterium]|nr:trigger factor [Elusimicrobiota bacterium]
MGIFSALKSDKPKFKKLKEEGCVVTLSVEVAPQEVTDQSQTALMRLQSLARIPGFRAGKAPLDIVKQHFAGRAREEAIDALIRKHVPAALEDLKLRVVETPTVSDVKWKDGEPLVITVQAEIAPTPVAKDYLKIPVTRKPQAADAAALDKRIEELRDAQARLDVAKDETVGEKNFVVIDYSASQGGKALPNAKGTSELVDMSSEQSVEGLSQGLKGMKRGETKTIKVKLGGKETDLTVTVTEIKTKVLPALDAEFAKDMGMESLDELKGKLKEVLDREVKSASESDVVRQIEEALVKANVFALPPSMVERQLEGMMDRMRRQLMGATQLSDKVLNDLRAKLQPKAEDEVRLAFVMSAIAEKEKIEVTDAELASELEAGLKDAENEAKKKELTEIFSKRKDQISHMIRERKTLNLLKEKAVYTEAKA